MAIFKFKENQVFINNIEAYPETSFYVNGGKVVIDSVPNIAGKNQSNIYHVEDGSISLYEINIDRPTGQEITASVFADGFRTTTKAVGTEGTYNHNVTFQPGDNIQISYNLSASLSYYYYSQIGLGTYGNRLDTDSKISSLAPDNGRIINGYEVYTLEETPNNATYQGYPVPYSLEGILNKYSFISPHFKMKTTIPHERDLRTSEMSLISIPSIFYGEKIKKGTVELNYYVSGSKIATLTDRGNRGELIQTDASPNSGLGSGSVAGIVLYNEGIIILTGSWQLGSDNSITYSDHEGTSTGDTKNKWTHFGSGIHQASEISATDTINSASFSIDFQGTTSIPTMTMLCNAPYSELNWSNNPTFLDHSSNAHTLVISSSNHYKEYDTDIANITDTELVGYIPEQVKETYISKVAIYDEKKNLIGVAKLANPVRKTPDRSYLFKLKLDL